MKADRSAKKPAGAARGGSGGLSGLGALRDTLKARAEQEAAERAREAAERQRRDEEAQAFRRAVDTMRDLKPLPPSGKVVLRKGPPPAPEPVQTQRDAAEVLRASLSDEFDPDSVLDADETLSWRRPGIGPDVLRKLRRGAWVVQAELDLHGLRSDEAREAVADFLRQAVRRGRRCVRVIHGKGLGSPARTPVLRNKVRAWLVQKEEVLAFVQAPPVQGGDGAVLVLLRPPGA